jgi:hypothetical protein
VQVDPIKPKLIPPGTKHMKLLRDILLSTFAFKINLRRYNMASHTMDKLHQSADVALRRMVGRCRLTL